MNFGNNQKAQWATSDEYDGWPKIAIKFLDIKIPDSEFVMISGIVMSPSEDKTKEVFDHRDVVHFEYREYLQTMQQQCYLEILIWLQEAVLRKRTEL
jgi:hypothetical protein